MVIIYTTLEPGNNKGYFGLPYHSEFELDRPTERVRITWNHSHIVIQIKSVISWSII